MKSGGSYTFRYAELSTVLAAVLPALTKHGFSLRQEVSEDKAVIITTLEHEHGVRTSRYPIFVFDISSQNFGGATTYARRYGLTLLLGVASEDDEDRNHGEDARWADRRPPPPGEDRTRRPDKPAFPVPRRSGPDAAPKAAAAPAPSEEPRMVEPPADPEEQTKAEGLIADSIQELHEAAIEGRRHGVEQIWGEIQGQPYVVYEVWQRLKQRHPDSFATVKSIVRPKDSKPRGPKK
jgi:ERF superfamily